MACISNIYPHILAAHPLSGASPLYYSTKTSLKSLLRCLPIKLPMEHIRIDSRPQNVQYMSRKPSNTLAPLPNNYKAKGDFTMDFKETSWNYISDDGIAYFSSSERKWITKIRKLAEANPNEVKIMREPEDNGGTIYAQVPATWLYVRKPKQVNMTEEQRAAAAERLKNARNS